MVRVTRKRKQDKSNFWGYHLIVNAASCNPRHIASSKIIKDFSKELVKRIHMIAYGPPTVVRFGTTHVKGYSLVQLIETSNITAHFVEETNDSYFDIFSCKKFNPEDALAVIQEYFEPAAMQTTFLKRQAHL